MNNILFSLGIIFFTSLFSVLVSAGAEAEFKDPAGFTQEEYRMVFTARADYQACLQEKSLKMIEQSTDPRQVADTAMKSCGFILEKLHMQITQGNYSPEVARKFSWNISNQEANKLLSNLMRYMATRGSNQPAAPATDPQ